VDAYGSPTAQDDLNTFSDAFGLPRTTITTIHPDGTPPYNNAVNGSQLAWAIETSIDLQSAHAIAPDANLVLIATNPAETQGVQGLPSMFKGEEYAVTHYPGSVISQSWGSAEESFHDAAPAQVARFDDVYRQAAANGVTALAASGDTGTMNFDKQGRAFPFPTVNWPSSDPLVTSVGGTWLQYGWRLTPTSPTDLSYINTPGSRTEAVWNDPARGNATGGGRSTLFSTPAFQSGIATSLLQGSRGAPDISWNAARNGGVLISTSFPGTRVGWHLIGGTSASTPQIAGVVALANQLAHDQGKGPVGYLNPYLYHLPAGDFHDIVPETFGSLTFSLTLDSNQVYGSSIPGMPVTAGYDLATGRGSPDAYQFVHDLVDALH
jgi:subtilase family serine protease